MADQSGFLRPGELGLRHGDERRHRERRRLRRVVGDRRRRDRRRAKFRNLVFTTMAVLAPHHVARSHLTLSPKQLAPEARVNTSVDPDVRLATAIDPATAVPPSRAYDDLIREAAALYRLSPTLIRSVMQAESAFNPLAVSPGGAMGLMQLMPDIARVFGIKDPFDPRENIMGGARLLRELLDSHDNDLPRVLAAYNAGPKAVMLYGGVPPFRETQGYVKKIIDLIADAHPAGDD